MAVISAHTHTGHLLFDVTVTLGQNKKSSWDIAHNIVGNSRKIVVAAEEELRFLGKKYPQVVRCHLCCVLVEYVSSGSCHQLVHVTTDACCLCKCKH